MWKTLAIMFLAMSLIPSGDTAGKLLSDTFGVHPLFVAWSRFAIGVLLVIPFFSRESIGLLRDWRIWLRALFLMGGITSLQFALRTEPIANVFAAFFIGPVFSFVLSALLLREPVTPARFAMLLLGFIGVLIVVRPGFGVTPNLGFAVLAGLFYGSYLTASKWLAHVASARTLMVTQLLIPTLLLAPVAVPQMPALDLNLSLLILISAACSTLGNFLLQVAYGRAPANALAPYVYFQLIAATTLGWLVFANLPDALTWLGLALITGAGLCSALLTIRHAARRSRRPATQGPNVT
jgi:drug/metabolite transporter (DMT)-like permease